MINHQANLNREAEFGLKRTPLQKAVEVESLELVTLLLKAKADVNCNIVATLLALGADLYASLVEINGRWPLEGAVEHERIEMPFFLWRVNGGLDPDQCDESSGREWVSGL
jgi:ankyrin repeat protein